MAAPDPGMPITFDGLVKLWQLIGPPIFAAVVYYVRDISKQLRAMNGRIIALEISTTVNEKTTRREFDQIQDQLRSQHSGQRESGP